MAHSTPYPLSCGDCDCGEDVEEPEGIKRRCTLDGRWVGREDECHVPDERWEGVEKQGRAVREKRREAEIVKCGLAVLDKTPLPEGWDPDNGV